MYCDTVDITTDNIINLAYLSDKYLVHQLKDQCVMYFRRHVLHKKTALKYAALDHEYVLPELHDAAMMYIQTYIREIFALPIAYDQLTRDTLRQILEKDFLNADEYTMYWICCNWAQHQCKKRRDPVRPKNIAKELGDLLPLIRFPVVMNNVLGHDSVRQHGLLTTEDDCKILEYIIQTDSPEQLTDVGQKPRRVKCNGTDAVKLHSVLGVPFTSSCVRRSNYGKLVRDGKGDIWCQYSLDMEEGLESSFCNFFSVQSDKECKKGCLVLSVEVPVSILAFRLQLNELVAHRYSEEGIQVKITITRKSHGRVRSRYIETLSVCPTVSPNCFHYHEARLKKPVALRACCRYEVVLECENTLYYHGVPHDYYIPEVGLARPFNVKWASMKKTCKSNESVSNLIHGINYKFKNGDLAHKYISRQPYVLFYEKMCSMWSLTSGLLPSGHSD